MNQDFGDFALFGFSQNPNGSILYKLKQWGLKLKTVDFGQLGQLYFYTTYGDVQENAETLTLKLGFARTPSFTSLSAQDLTAQKIISPQEVEPEAIRGNSLLACFSQTAPEFLVYQTVFTPQQLYYTNFDGDILCATNQRCLVNLLDRVELNEEIIPYHFMFQLVPGPLTYYNNVHRLFPGQRLHWKDGSLNVKQVKNLRFSDIQPIDKVDEHNPDRVYEGIKAVVDFYLNDVEKAGYKVTNLLSGGVDSGILQVVINERLSSTEEPSSYSYQVHVPGFEFEALYARQASQILGTDHTVADIYPEDFPAMIERAVEAVAQPIPGEADACKIMMAEFLAKQDTSRFFFSGQVADALYGMALARRLAIFNLFEKIPASEAVFKSMAALVKPGSARMASRLKNVARTLSATNDLKSYEHWSNAICNYANLPIARRSFGDDSLQQALVYRRELEKQYLGSNHLIEQLHTIDMLTEGYEPAMLGTQMFLTQNKHQIYPFLDEDIIRNAFSFSSDIRFIKPGLGFMDQNNIKYLLKTVLAEKSYGDIALKKKGASAFGTDLFKMMKTGVLKDMTQAIERPGFLSQTDFEALLKKPDHFLWNLLTFDVFKKRVLNQLS